MSVKIRYYAAIAEQAGKEKEQRDCAGLKASELYTLLRKEYDIPFTQEEIRVAINHKYSDFSSTLQDNDVVVFISPVSGG